MTWRRCPRSSACSALDGAGQDAIATRAEARAALAAAARGRARRGFRGGGATGRRSRGGAAVGVRPPRGGRRVIAAVGARPAGRQGLRWPERPAGRRGGPTRIAAPLAGAHGWPARWSPTCRRCGRARCARACSAWPARRSSRSSRRPGRTARGSGNREFFDWLHAGHRSLSVDFGTRAGRAALAALLEVADVVIEASRPRALAALGAGTGHDRAPAGPGLAQHHRVRAVGARAGGVR